MNAQQIQSEIEKLANDYVPLRIRSEFTTRVTELCERVKVDEAVETGKAFNRGAIQALEAHELARRMVENCHRAFYGQEIA